MHLVFSLYLLRFLIILLHLHLKQLILILEIILPLELPFGSFDSCLRVSIHEWQRPVLSFFKVRWSWWHGFDGSSSLVLSSQAFSLRYDLVVEFNQRVQEVIVSKLYDIRGVIFRLYEGDLFASSKFVLTYAQVHHSALDVVVLEV